MTTSLRFALTGSGQQLVACAELVLSRGHRIVGILSDSPEVGAWASRRGGIALQPRDGSEAGWLSGTPFDYLLSIVNHAVLPPELIAAPEKRAVNYHDSLLPEYAGFNATSWAILDGKTSHGISWHEMTSDVDGGGILLQRHIDISDDETAFTLGVKCSETGVEAFALLLDQMESDTLSAIPQSGARSFHLRSDRPGIALMDFSRPAAELHAMVRGLNLGPEDNWMCKPKLRLSSGFLCVMETSLEPVQQQAAAAGTVLSISDRGIMIACGGGDDVAATNGAALALLVSEFAALDGTLLDAIKAAAQFGIAEGQRIPKADATTVDRANKFDATITKSERFWVKRLAALESPQLPTLVAHDGKKRPRGIRRAFPAAIAKEPAEKRSSILVAALGAYLSRLGAGEAFDLGAHITVPGELRALFSPVVPLRCKVDPKTVFESLVQQTSNELATIAKRRTYARDILLRYKSLRARNSSGYSLPIAVWCSDSPVDVAAINAHALSESTHLNLLTDAGAVYAWVFDEAAMSAQAASTFAERFDVFLEAALREPHARICDLPLLPRAERELLLETFQQTSQPYATDVCVHEHFEQQVERTPHETAVVFGEAQFSYRELNERANNLAHTLRGAGVGPEVLVGICVERSLDLIVGLLGILKAGGAYVPLDPAYPRDRLAIMLEDSKAPIVVTQSALVARLPASNATVVLVDKQSAPGSYDNGNPASGVRGDNLAYVIFTSGSTGRPKGTMLEHRNVSNFFAGMDAVVDGGRPGTWLALTSISFDISVLELFWTLARGFKVVIAPETDRASLEQRNRGALSAAKPVDFGLFYFSADSSAAEGGGAYRLLLEGAKFADENDFAAVWTPERHFHAFGGLYPNPAVTTAALATITKRIHLRAGSVVLPLHNPLRVAEDWAVIDQLSGGRIGLSFASGWHVNDFAFMPDNFERRREIMLEYIDTVLKLWRGEKVAVRNGAGTTVEVSVLPRPVQQRPPLWLASAGSIETFVLAGRIGANVLTNMLGQDLADLKNKFAAYRAARREHGHEGDGIISVMLHTFVCGSTEEARQLARKPFANYLATSFDLVKVAPKMFPAFQQPSRSGSHDDSMNTAEFTDEDMSALLDHAFDRYFETAGLFGTPERALEMVNQLAEIGATEMACLIDFGIDPAVVLESLPHLKRLQQLCRERPVTIAAVPEKAPESIAELIRRHHVTHMQCTPSMARVLASDSDSLAAVASLDKLLLGGEALLADLAEQLAATVTGTLLNMYGPTETTVWSTTARVTTDAVLTIGKPIANTTIRILDRQGQLVPIGIAGELCIGGAGVARGYLGRPDLTAERFIDDPFTPGERIYRTGDLARYRSNGEIEFLGRIDHQVKISGHRIELSEIESVLGRHGAVRESVVVARSGEGASSSPALVAYVVLSGYRVAANGGVERVHDWQAIWDATYARTRRSNGVSDPRFRIDGWNDSYTGEPIPAEEMREWLDNTVQRILEQRPRRVLEIGCGTGLVLYRLLPHVEHYTGVDISAEALAAIQHELTADEAKKVTLLMQPAHALEGVPAKSCDMVVINSVAQYFPDAAYFRKVLQRATEIVVDGGCIFVGDVRSLAHLEAFHASVEMEQAAEQMDRAELRTRIDRRLAHESELLLSEEFFHALVSETPRLAAMDVELKRGGAHNEMTRFRYDVLLHVGTTAPARRVPSVRPVNEESLAAIRGRLSGSPDVLFVTDIPNARLAGIAAAQRELAANTPGTAGVLRQHLSAADRNGGVDPEALFTVSDAYEARIRWARSGDPARFDALFVRKSGDVREQWSFPDDASSPAAKPRAVANTPVRMGDDETMTTELRSHLQQSLPDYMIPATFVVMDALPLTPNGKIDRKALPEPARRLLLPDAQYAPPTNELEEKIAEIWRDLLAIERVGRQDNIFDLGANSLLTMQANNRLSTLLGRKVSLVSMFRYPTVATLAAHLGAGDTGGEGVAQANEKRAQGRAARAALAAERRRLLRAERKEK